MAATYVFWPPSSVAHNDRSSLVPGPRKHIKKARNLVTRSWRSRVGSFFVLCFTFANFGL